MKLMHSIIISSTLLLTGCDIAVNAAIDIAGNAAISLVDASLTRGDAPVPVVPANESN